MLNLFNAPNIGELVSDIHVQNKTLNRKLFLKILQNIKFLARQGIAFRGQNEAESNFTQLIKLRESDNPALSSWMKKRTNKYISPDIQNEILQLMSRSILLNIAQNIHSSNIFTIMADEC